MIHAATTTIIFMTEEVTAYVPLMALALATRSWKPWAHRLGTSSSTISIFLPSKPAFSNRCSLWSALSWREETACLHYIASANIAMTVGHTSLKTHQATVNGKWQVSAIMNTDHFQGPEWAQAVATLAVGPGAPARILSFLQNKLLSCKTWTFKPHPSEVRRKHIHSFKARETTSKHDVDAVKKMFHWWLTGWRETLTVLTQQWLSQLSVSLPTHLYIHQTTPPSFHGSSRIQKLPTTTQEQLRRQWCVISAMSQVQYFLTYFNFNRYIYLCMLCVKVPYMWLQLLLGSSLQAAGLGFPAVLSFSLYKAQ